MKLNINKGAYPTMITPYNENGKVDYGAVKALTEWYWEKGCDGIFASCQSSEILFLSLEDRVKLAKTVSDTAIALAAKNPERKKMSVVASGHVSDDFDEQCAELNAIAETGVDAVVLISNRSDIENTSDEKWIADTEAILAALPAETMVGTYECPRPYKRLLTEKMTKWIAESGRFAFIKDTCCDADEIAKRLRILDGSGVGLFNANGQTCLESLKSGGDGYCGIMCNFHPELYVWLCHNFKKYPEMAQKVQAALSMCAFTENPVYPVTAKYHLSHHEGIPMSLYARSADRRTLTNYYKLCVDQMKLITDEIKENIKNLK
ncbi:MAG: dihydrodipicolinate synthase family protein [Clostridia bacterium]|nr:dihydrodipicolinate synthase family protein [Clostridia bacterium]